MGFSSWVLILFLRAGDTLPAIQTFSFADCRKQALISESQNRNLDAKCLDTATRRLVDVGR